MQKVADASPHTWDFSRDLRLTRDKKPNIQAYERMWCTKCGMLDDLMGRGRSSVATFKKKASAPCMPGTRQHDPSIGPGVRKKRAKILKIKQAWVKQVAKKRMQFIGISMELGEIDRIIRELPGIYEKEAGPLQQ